MKLIAGNSNPTLAAAMAQHLGMQLTQASIRRFSDGEIFMEVEVMEVQFMPLILAYPWQDTQLRGLDLLWH